MAEARINQPDIEKAGDLFLWSMFEAARAAGIFEDSSYRMSDLVRYMIPDYLDSPPSLKDLTELGDKAVDKLITTALENKHRRVVNADIEVKHLLTPRYQGKHWLVLHSASMA